MRMLGWLGVTGPVALVLGSLAAGALQSEYDPRREDLSALAAGDAQHPVVMVLAMLLFASGAVALAVLIGQVLPRSESGDASRVLMLVLGLGVGTAALLRNDCSTELPACAGRESFSWHHYGHDLSGVLVVVLLVACPFVLGAAFRGDPARTTLSRASRAAGVLAAVSLVLYLTTGKVWPADQGLLQRLSMAPTLIWMGVVSVVLSRSRSS